MMKAKLDYTLMIIILATQDTDSLKIWRLYEYEIYKHNDFIIG